MTITDLAKEILAYFNANPDARLGAVGVAHNLKLEMAATEKALTHLNEMGDLKYCHLKKSYMLPGAAGALIDLDEPTPIDGAKPERRRRAAARNQPVRIRRKPYTPFATAGYKVNGDNVTIFLDRRNNARSVTLSAAQLQHILDGVQT